MKHIIEKVVNNNKQSLTLIENEYEENFTPLRILIENESDGKEIGNAIFTFYEKKELSKFIGVLLHIQSKMK